MSEYYKNKTVLVTGAAGSLGRRLVIEFLKPEYAVATLRLFDNNENGMARLNWELKDNRLRWLIGNIREKERLMRAMENIDIVIHTAAMKHIEFCQQNPFESLLTNVIGTQNCIDAALSNNIDNFVFLSSDKACGGSTYGKCKSLSENLTLDAHNYRGNKRTKLSVIRPPNYYGSDCSVSELWNYQKNRGESLTVTSPKATRYFMDFQDMIPFIIKCITMMKGGEIFVPSTGVQELKIIDLAKKMSENIKIVGLRKGEQLHELLMDPSEEERAEMVDGIWVIR